MRLLPVMDVFNHAIKSTLNNLSFAFYVSWPWMAIIFPANLIANAYLLANGDLSDDSPVKAFISLALGLLSIMAFASIAVNWHRYILLDEVPQASQRLRMDSTVWRYVLNTIVIIFGVVIMAMVLIAVGAVILAYVLGESVANAESSLYGPTALLLIALAVVAMVIFYRLSVKLPGVALERTDFSFGDAFKATEGNFIRFVGLGILYAVLGIVLGLVVGAIAGGLATLLGWAGLFVGVAVLLALQWIFTILGITTLTSLYGYFVENRNF